MTPAAQRRLIRARTLAQSVLANFNQGNRGRNLEQFLTAHGPADVWQEGSECHCRCYGIQPPPCTSRTSAIVAWAQLTLQSTDEIERKVA